MRFNWGKKEKEYSEIRNNYQNLYDEYYFKNCITENQIFQLKKFPLCFVCDFLINELQSSRETLPDLFLRILLDKRNLPMKFIKARKELGLYQAWKEWYPEMKEN